MKKRVVSWLLVVLMLTSMLPTGVWAEDVYRSSEDTGRYGVSTLASAADAELEGFFDEWEGIATVANAATRGFVRDGDKLKSGNSSASSTRSTLTVTMLKAAELSFDYRLSGPNQSGMEVKNSSKTLYTYSSYGAGGAKIVKGTDSGTAPCRPTPVTSSPSPITAAITAAAATACGSAISRPRCRHR